MVTELIVWAKPFCGQNGRPNICVIGGRGVPLGDEVLHRQGLCRKCFKIKAPDPILEEERTASPEMYTRPEVLEWKGKKYKVPKVLLGGNHKEIEEWRKSKLG